MNLLSRLSALDRIADEATPGPWEDQRVSFSGDAAGYNISDVNDEDVARIGCGLIPQERTDANARHIALHDPLVSKAFSRVAGSVKREHDAISHRSARQDTAFVISLMHATDIALSDLNDLLAKKGVGA